MASLLDRSEANVALKEIRSLSGLGPPEAVMALAQWVSWRYAMPLSAVLRSCSPDRNVYSLPDPPATVDPMREPSDRGDVVLERVCPTADPLPRVLEALEAKTSGSLLVLTPSSGWSERLAQRLRRRGIDVAEDWSQAAAGWPVVVGSRRAALAPIPRLGAALVFDAHDYRDRFDATRVVAKRAEMTHARCRLLTPTPSASLLYDYGPALKPDPSEERDGWAQIICVDHRAVDPRLGLYSDEFVSLARSERSPLLCILNRTGRARLLACVACSELARCERCGDRVIEHDGRLICQRCGEVRPMLCASCGGARLKILRIGVSRAREELHALLGVEVGEVTGDVDAIPAAPVLVGTEALLHRVRQAGAVCFLDFDQHLFAPRLSASEESISLLARASRIVGGRRGVVMVQTRMPEHPAILAARSADPSVATELELRARLSVPPFVAWASVRSNQPPRVDGAAVSYLGEGRYLVSAPDHAVLCDAVATLGAGTVIDPVDL